MSTNNVKSGQQGTDRPWERPGQSSQDPSIDPPRRDQRDGHYEAPSPDPLNLPPRTAPPAGIRRVERLTEDDMAQAALGGPKGSPELTPAPLTKTEREQNSPNDDPGHVA